MYIGKCIRPGNSIIGRWRRASIAQSTTTAAAIGFFLWAQLWPAVSGAKELVQTAWQQRAATAPKHDSLSSALHSVEATLKDLDRRLSSKGKSKNAKALNQNKAQLKALREQLVDADKETLASFERDLQHIQKHKLSDVIKERHAHTLANYEARQREMLAHLDAIDAARDDASLAARVRETKQWLAEQQIERKQQPYDPQNLPSRVAADMVRLPKTSAKDFREGLNGGVKTKGIDQPLPTNQRKRAATKMERGALEHETTLAQYQAMNPTLSARGGSAGLFGIGAIAPFDTAPYLTQTEDAQITSGIQDLAAQLHHNPVEIYNWVRNNIEFVPTYGSLQGSDLTLNTRQGNAFDTSSLLIALLRASGIPARYVYGTILVPVERAMNWVGGMTSSDGAQNLLGQGGVPNRGLVAGGKVVAIEMEHVWVEAFVDFYPSRGAKNSSPDTWVPIDAAFKQYAYNEGMNILANVPFDAASIDAQFQQRGYFNSDVLQGFDQAYIVEKFRDYRSQVNAYVASQSDTATVEQVLGEKNIITQAAPVLPNALPYNLVAVGATWSAVPDSAKYKFVFALSDESEGALFSITRNTVGLASKNLALSFRAASEADRQSIESYLPRPHEDGTPVEPSELPTSLPGYLFEMVPQFSVDGLVLAEGPPVAMGTQLRSSIAYVDPQQNTAVSENVPIVGEYQAIGLDLQGASVSQLTKLVGDLQEVRDQLQAGFIEGSTNEKTTGKILSIGIQLYLAQNDLQALLVQKAAKVVSYRLPSFGMFQTRAEPEYGYGVPMSVGFPSLLMDVDLLSSSAAARNGDLVAASNYVRLVGTQMSALEGDVPEKLFARVGGAQGFSAAKLLALASDRGQRILRITSSNVDQMLPNALPDDAKEEIRQYTYAQRDVLIHEAPVNDAGVPLFGYEITDPVTGSGAYKIAGGADGGDIRLAESGLSQTMGMAVSVKDDDNGSGVAFTVLVELVLHLAESALAHAAAKGAEIGHALKELWHKCSGIEFAFDALMATIMGLAVLMITLWFLEGPAVLAIIFGVVLAMLYHFLILEMVATCEANAGPLGTLFARLRRSSFLERS